MKKIVLTIGLISLSAGSTMVAADTTTNTIFAIGKVGTGFFGMYYGGKLFTEQDQSSSNKVIGASLFLTGASLACNKEQQALALITSGLTYAGNNVSKLVSRSSTPPSAAAANTASSAVHTTASRAAAIGGNVIPDSQASASATLSPRAAQTTTPPTGIARMETSIATHGKGTEAALAEI